MINNRTIDLIPEEETKITCNTPDGKKIELDVMDLHQILLEVYEEFEEDEIPRAKLYKRLVDKFAEYYGFRMSTVSMERLMELRGEMLRQLKKSTSSESEHGDTTEGQ